jgi:hypothetical protein
VSGAPVARCNGAAVMVARARSLDTIRPIP